MKKLLILFLGTIISFVSYGQSDCLPDSILSKVIDELIVKDHLQFTVNELDSTLVIYKSTVASQKEEILILKLDTKNYVTVITQLKEEVQLQKDEVRNLRRQNIKGRITSFLKGVVIGVTVVVIYIVVHKT